MSSNIRIGRICLHCKNKFEARTTVTNYCSDVCRKRAYKARLLSENVSKSEEQTRTIETAARNDVQQQAFLSVKHLSKLLHCSLRTIYRFVQDGTIPSINLGERKTIIRRIDVDRFFENQLLTKERVKKIQSEQRDTIVGIQDSYSLKDIEQKYKLSSKAVYDLLKRHDIKKHRRGKEVFVSRASIDQILTL